MLRKSKLAFLILVFINLLCSKRQERIKPALTDITEAVYASATVKAAGQYSVFSKVNGLLKKIRVKPGQTVKRGDILFILDNEVAALNTQDTRVALEQSRKDNRKNSEKLRQMQLNVKAAAERFWLDSALYSRQKQLWDQKIGTQLEYEQRRIAFINSKNNYQVQLVELQQLQRNLKTELERNEINYNKSREVQSEYIIRSNISGKVFDILPEEGELVSPQSPLAILGNSNDFILEMKVDENDIARIRQGQRIEIIMDSYKGKVFQGIVTNIHPLMDERSRTFTVDGRFVDAPPTLYPNLTAEVNIIIRSKKNALVIPRSYLENNKYVWITKSQRREVKTGLRDFQKVEILDGLDTSETIYKPE